MENIKYIRVWSDFVPQLAKMTNEQRGAAFAILLNEIFGINIPDTDCDIAQIVAAGMVEKAKAEIAEAEQVNQARSEKVKARWQKKDEETPEYKKHYDPPLHLVDERMDISTTKKEIDKENSSNAPKRNTPNKPTKEQIKEYCQERNNGIDADYFYDYYEARGWKYNNNQPMKDFKAAVRTWEKNGKNKGGGAPQTHLHPNVLHQQDMVYKEF